MAVKGISRQVILVQSPDPKLFDQAIFILNDSAVNGGGITDEQLLQEANRLIRYPKGRNQGRYRLRDFMLLGIGASFTFFVWMLTLFF